MRSRTILGSVVAGIGVLMLAGAAILYWGIVPAQAKLPADTDTTRQYAGIARLLVQPQALAAGDRERAVVINAPVTASRTVKVLATDGDAAQVSDSRTLTTVSGQPISGTSTTYAVDRKTLEATNSHPSDWNVAAHQGLTVSWPLGAGKQDYTGWVSDTQTTTTIRYLREEQRNGVNTYVYTADAPEAPIKDPQVLASLPPALPGNALAALGSALPIPEQLRAQLAAIAPQSTQPVPLNYTYQGKAIYWVEPTTGTVVDVQREEIRRAGIALPGASAATPRIPIYDVAVGNTTASVTAATSDANSDAYRLNSFGKTLPLIGVVFGGLAVVGGTMLIVVGRRRTPQA